MTLNTSPTHPQRPELTVQTKISGQQTVFARLHGLFPNTAPPANTSFSNSNDTLLNEKSQRPGPVPSQRASNVPKSIKIRLLTWNMHDSVPKGDLEELFGKVPYYTPTPESKSLPQFTADAVHPYHLIVVAGQETPSVSGIPMGLGTGFKLYDKEKDREERDNAEKPRSTKHGKDESLRPKKSYEDFAHESPPSGWTSMIEDWLCYGGSAAKTVSPAMSDISIPKPLSPRIASKEPRRGPYQLLCKERLLGIYLAIYIHRDAKPFVRGTSKSFVTSGLMGGRWGNKGGVGISVNLDGKTFLFLNCHLAAQQDKANLHDRLNNYNKIKAELAVDDFLPNEDPRVMAEDITDKFDYSFVFGDLNFRLDISRLHADWLISRQDYAQALAFDQLRNLMLNGRAFVGFHEAPIDFPPTFKYDVLRTLKGSRRKNLERWKSDRSRRITEVEEKDTEEHEEQDDDDKSSEEEEGEEASVASSVWTSTHSRHRNDDRDEGYAQGHGVARSSSSKLSITVATAATKAKAKWLALMSPASIPPSPTKWLRSKSSLIEPTFPARSRRRSHSLDLPDADNNPQRDSTEDCPDLPADLSLLPPPSLGRVESTKSSSSKSGIDEDGNRAVYDTSSKKRVPSWCDRILWKSTVEADPEPEYEETENSIRPRTRVGQFLANAFRPLSTRSRRGSLASIATSGASSVATTATPGQSSSESPLPSPDLLEHIIPFSRFVYPENRASTLTSKSVEQLNTSSAAETDESASAYHSPEASKRSSTPQFSTDSPTNAHALRDHNTPSTSRWRFLQSLLTHNASGSIGSASDTTVPKLPRKGDVVCLNYNALDDRAMRRLEGRSDHRPVVGSYAVYI